MKKRWISTLALCAFGALLLTAPAAAAKKKDDAKKSEEGEDEKPKWDVSSPPGEWKSIKIDTTETTWSAVDVSPDGTTVIFDMLGDLYSVPIAGGEAKPLSSGIPWDYQPRFSPDGKRIAFISDRDGAENLWVMKADGSEPKALSTEKENLVHNPYWSPDGEWIAAMKGFMSTRSIAAGEIWLFHSGGGNGLQLVERPLGPKDQKNIAEPSFSRDGKYVYFTQDTTPGARWQYNKDSTGQIFVIKRLELATGKVETLAGGPGGAIRPTPSPDGKLLAFVKRTPSFTSAIYLMDLESGRQWAIYDKMDRDLQEANGSEANTPAFGWTPDSASIVFWSGGKIRRVDVKTKTASEIPIHVATERKIQPALHFPVAVAPDEFDVKMLRWTQLSPDGSKALFQALGHIYVREMPDGEPRRLTTQNDHFEFHPSFSRDGRQIVYTTWDDQELGTIRVVGASGGAGRTITPHPGHYVEPRFSPDGKWIVYRSFAGGYLTSPLWSLEPGIDIIPAGGGEPKRISPSGFNAHFGAESDRVFFSDLEEDVKLILKSRDLDGREERTHLTGESITEYSISPDGRWVAFTEDYNAFVAPFKITGKTVEIGSKIKSLPVRQVSKRSGEFLTWSADSKSLRWGNGATLYTRDLKDAFSFLDGAPEELPEPVETGVHLGFKAKADKPSGTIALVGGRVVTMRDAQKTQEVIENGVVLVNGNRIQAVGRAGDVKIPAGAFTLDVSGKTVLPGLLDAHAHGAMGREEIIPEQNWMQFSNLAFGVTTIHDPSNDTTEIFAAAEMQKAGEILGPRIYSTGTILYGAKAAGYHAEVGSLEDAKFHVQRLKDAGAISVKSYNQPRREARQEIIEAGRELGIMVVPEGGSKFEFNMTEVVDGHTGIEHAIPLVSGYEDVLQLWSQTGSGYTPTFGVAYGGLSGETYWYDRTNVWEDARLMRYVPRFIVEPDAIRRLKAPEWHYNHIHVAEFAKKLVDRGVTVQIGAHGQREGLASHWELWMMQQGGFTPWEAFRSGTIQGARYLGMDEETGSLEAGKLADLFVVDGNPLENIRLSENVAYTMINGRLFDVTTMSQIAPDKTTRQEFFWEKEGGDTLPPPTAQWLRDFKERMGWTHSGAR